MLTVSTLEIQIIIYIGSLNYNINTSWVVKSSGPSTIGRTLVQFDEFHGLFGMCSRRVLRTPSLKMFVSDIAIH